MKYRKEVDGLRALAIIPVVLYHAGFSSFSGGFVGVDVFFVISGYLITSLLIGELDDGRFSVAQFYERRARRILPALYLVMAASSLAAWAFLLPEERQEFFQSVVSVPVFASNILFWLKSGYFDTGAELKPLLHTWSLAVEEQYYIVFPLLLLSIWRLGKARLTAVIAIIGVSSLLLAEWGTRVAPSASFFLLPTRAWELAIGALVALILAQRTDPSRQPLPPVAREVTSLLGLAMIVGSAVLYSPSTPFPGLYALVPTIGTALIIAFATPQAWIGRILAHRLLVGIGLISYSTYLWHQPLFAFTRDLSLAAPGPWLMSGLTGASFLLGYLSWRFVEAPFRDRSRFGRRTIFSAALATSTGFVLLGLAGHFSDGFASTFYRSLDARQRGILVTPKGVMADDGACRFFSRDIDARTRKRFADCAARGTRATVIIGDSHAMNLYNAISSNMATDFVVGLARPGCRAYSVGDDCMNDQIATFIAANSGHIALVIYNQAGFTLVADADGKPANRELFRRVPVPVYAADSTFVDAVRRYLGGIGAHVPVIWLGPWIEPNLNAQYLKRLALRCALDAPKVDTNIVRTFAAMDSLLSRRTTGQPGVTYVSAVAALDFDSKTDLYDCNGVYWRDTDHWSVKGAERFGPRLASLLVGTH